MVSHTITNFAPAATAMALQRCQGRLLSQANCPCPLEPRKSRTRYSPNSDSSPGLFVVSHVNPASAEPASPLEPEVPAFAAPLLPEVPLDATLPDTPLAPPSTAPDAPARNRTNKMVRHKSIPLAATRVSWRQQGERASSRHFQRVLRHTGDAVIGARGSADSLGSRSTRGELGIRVGDRGRALISNAQ